MALATIDQLKEYFGDTSDKDDALLTRIIAAASDQIENYCGRTFESTNYTSEMYDGTGNKTLVLRHFPIIGTPTVLEYGNALTVGTDPVTSPDVLVYPDLGHLVRQWFYWIPRRNWYSVTYTAGFASVPGIIVQACLDISALMLREKERIGQSGKTVAGQQVSYIRSLPEAIQRGLDGYADLVLGSHN